MNIRRYIVTVDITVSGTSYGHLGIPTIINPEHDLYITIDYEENLKRVKQATFAARFTSGQIDSMSDEAFAKAIIKQMGKPISVGIAAAWPNIDKDAGWVTEIEIIDPKGVLNWLRDKSKKQIEFVDHLLNR